MRKTGSAAEWDRVRSIAANMFDDGKEPAEIARHLAVAAQTVRQWRRDYRAGAARPCGR